MARGNNQPFAIYLLVVYSGLHSTKQKDEKLDSPIKNLNFNGENKAHIYENISGQIILCIIIFV